MSANSLTGSNYTAEYIGAEQFINKRDIQKAIFNRYREDEGLGDLLINLGKKRKTDNTTFHHFEHDYLINEVEVDSVVAPNPAAPGDAVIIQITTDSHQESGLKSPFLKSDLVQLAGIRCRIEAIDKSTANAHEYTLRPVNSADDFTPILGSLPTLPVNWYGTAFADGTLQPGSSVRKPIRYENDTQILKTNYETHGSVAANKSEVEINGKPYYYLQGVEDATNKQMIAVNYTLILGERADNLVDTTAPDGAADVTTTEGLEKAIDNRGITQTYVTWDYSQFEQMTRNLDVERVADEYCGLAGTDQHLGHEAAQHSRNQDTGIRYTMFDKKTKGGMSYGDEGRAVSYGFDSYRMGGRTFHVKKWDALTYKPVTGFAGNPYSDMGFWMPMKTYKDAKTEKGLYSVLLRYKANDMENRFMKEWQRDRTVTNKDSFEWNLQSEVGLQLGLVNGFTKTTK